MSRLLALQGSLLLAVVLAWAAPAAAQSGDAVGRVISQVGEVVAVAPDGERRSLRRRSSVHEGETVVTGDAGRAQVRFKDKGLVDLKPGTRLKVRRYRAKAAGDGEDSAVMELLKGGMRTITGAVGGGEEQEYEVETPVASIGIRGTQYLLRLCQGDCGPDIAEGLYGGVTQGRIGVSNAAGTAEFGGDRYFRVGSRSDRPEGMLTPPGDLFTGARGQTVTADADDGVDGEGGDVPDQPGFLSAVAGSDPSLQDPSLEESFEDSETVEESGANASVGGVDTSDLNSLAGVMAGGYNGSLLDLDKPVEGGTLPTYREGAVYLDDQGRVVGVEVADDVGREVWLGNDRTLVEGGTYTEANSAFSVEWGRWSGEFQVVGSDLAGGSKLTDGDFHYAYSRDYTTATQLANLGTTATYSAVVASTTPTDLYGAGYSLGTLSFDANLSAPEITGATLNLTHDAGLNPIYTQFSGSHTFGPEAHFILEKLSGSYGELGTATGKLEAHFLGNNAEGAVVYYEAVGEDATGVEQARVNGAAVVEPTAQ